MYREVDATEHCTTYWYNPTPAGIGSLQDLFGSTPYSGANVLPPLIPLRKRMIHNAAAPFEAKVRVEQEQDIYMGLACAARPLSSFVWRQPGIIQTPPIKTSYEWDIDYNKWLAKEFYTGSGRAGWTSSSLQVAASCCSRYRIGMAVPASVSVICCTICRPPNLHLSSVLQRRSGALFPLAMSYRRNWLYSDLEMFHVLQATICSLKESRTVNVVQSHGKKCLAIGLGNVTSNMGDVH